MPGGGDGFGSGYDPLATANATCNLLAKDVIGNKADNAAAGAVTCTESLMAYTKQIVTAIAGAGGICNVVIPLGPYGQNVVQDGVDNSVDYTVHLVNLNGNVLADSETTPGTYDVVRIRGGTSCQVVTAAVATEASGVITGNIDFQTCAARWTDGDLGFIEFNNITATVCCVVSTFPVLRKYFRITQEECIEAKIDVIDAYHDVGVADAVTNTVMSDVVGNKTDAAAVGCPSCVESLMAYSKETQIGLGFDGATNYAGAFNQFSTAGAFHGQHNTVSMLFVIPEAVACINTHNANILVQMQTMGNVDTIPQSMALTHPHFGEYNIIVLGTDNGTVWCVANLVNIQLFPSPVIVVDATAAVAMLMGTDGGDAAAKTVFNGITEIEAIDVGLGVTGITGANAGANTISSAATYNTLDMSDADLTDVFYGYETANANTDVLLGVVHKIQPNGTRGILTDATETPGDRWFYGPGYSANNLNTLGNALLKLLIHMTVQATSANLAFEISGDIGDIDKKLFGNQATCFNNGNPLVEWLAGRNSTGTANPVGKSLYNIMGASYLDACGGLGTDTIAADLGLIHAQNVVIDAFHDVPVANAACNVVISDVVGNKSDIAGTGSVCTNNSLMAYVKQSITAVGANDTNTVTQPQIMGNKADSGIEIIAANRTIMNYLKGLVNIGGARNTAVNYVVSCTDGLMDYVKALINVSIIATGTLTATSATAPRDNCRTEPDGYFDGATLMTTAGCVSFQPRTITSWGNGACGCGTGTFTLDAEQPLTAVSGTVAYVVLAGNERLVPTADGSNNTTSAHVVGNKADAAAAGAVSCVESLMAYAKQLVTAQQAEITGVGVRQVATTTLDLNQCAATYDLFTGTTQDFVLTGLSFKLPNVDVSNDCAITSISIVTDDVTAQTIINTCDGAKANLTAEAEISWTGLIKITTCTKIQLIISGGTADATTTTLITAEGYAIVAGGNLT